MEDFFSTEILYTNRWIAYFDLLGFTNLVRDKLLEEVLSIYEDAVNALKESIYDLEPTQVADKDISVKKKIELNRHGISYTWFSDSFIIFSRGDSDKEFERIESTSRKFFQKLILRKIPVRGALTLGPLYTQQEKNVFIGKALIDAYEYGEKQNWLGFVLTPRVHEHLLLKPHLVMITRLSYRMVHDSSIIPRDVLAYSFNNGSANYFLKAIS